MSVKLSVSDTTFLEKSLDLKENIEFLNKKIFIFAALIFDVLFYMLCIHFFIQKTQLGILSFLFLIMIILLFGSIYVVDKVQLISEEDSDSVVLDSREEDERSFKYPQIIIGLTICFAIILFLYILSQDMYFDNTEKGPFWPMYLFLFPFIALNVLALTFFKNIFKKIPYDEYEQQMLS